MKVGDPIAVVEAGYRLDNGFEEWLDGLLEAVAPSFGDSLGQSTHAIRVHATGAEVLVSRTWPINRPDFEQLTRLIHSTMPRPDEMTSEYARSIGLVTARQALSASAENESRFDKLVAGSGMADNAGVVFNEGPIFVFLGGLYQRRVKPTARDQALWDRVAIHLSHALRLRLTIGNLEDQASRTDAVLDPDGKLIHAESGVAPELRRLLRTAVQRADKARTRKQRASPESALDLWHGLVDGKWSLLDRFDSDGRRYVVACQNPLITPSVRELTTREREAAQLAALGFSNAEAAYALGTSESTAATHTANALNKLNVARRAELVALWMALAAQDAERLALLYKPIRLDAVTSGVASPPDLAKLTEAEKEVTGLLAQGLTNAQVAEQRKVSERTVANQLQSVFRKLGVSSRSELMVKLGRE